MKCKFSLTSQDGNKLYTVNGVFQDADWTQEIALESSLSGSLVSALPWSDVFVTLKVSVDLKATVAPIAVAPKKTLESGKEAGIHSYLSSLGNKVTTLGTYSYYESSNQLWVKCHVSVKGIKAFPKEKIEVRFAERTLDVIVKDWPAGAKQETLHFGVRKLHCKTVPE